MYMTRDYSISLYSYTVKTYLTQFFVELSFKTDMYIERKVELDLSLEFYSQRISNMLS